MANVTIVFDPTFQGEYIKMQNSQVKQDHTYFGFYVS